MYGRCSRARAAQPRVCSPQEDYRRTVTEIDEKEYISLRLIISELRNQYVSEKRAGAGSLHSSQESPSVPLLLPPRPQHAACLLPALLWL